MIKKLSSLLLLATLAFVSSCSSDSDGGGSGTRLKYRIVTGSGCVISSIHYRDSDGSFVTATTSNPTEWSKEITVERPFTASFDAVVTNGSDTFKSVNTHLYVNGEEVQGGSNSVSSGSSVTVQETMDLE